MFAVCYICEREAKDYIIPQDEIIEHMKNGHEGESEFEVFSDLKTFLLKHDLPADMGPMQ